MQPGEPAKTLSVCPSHSCPGVRASSFGGQALITLHTPNFPCKHRTSQGIPLIMGLASHLRAALPSSPP